MQLGLKKKLALEAFRLYRHNEIKAHPLTYFFWECTLRCNLHCQHCGSDCVADAIPDMPRVDFLRVLDSLAPHVDPKNFTVVITGGAISKNAPKKSKNEATPGAWSQTDWLSLPSALPSS